MANVVFNRAKARFADGTFDWDSGSQDFGVLLVNASFTNPPDPDLDLVDDITPGTTECAGGTYVRKLLASRVVVQDDTNNLAQLNAAALTWTALTVTGNTVRGAIVYRRTTQGVDDNATDQLVCFIDANPDRVTNGGDVVLTFTNGVCRFS